MLIERLLTAKAPPQTLRDIETSVESRRSMSLRIRIFTSAVVTVYLSVSVIDRAMPFKNVRKFHRNNVQTLRRSPAAEISGALGDLGTLLPLMIALAIQGSISLSSTLVLSGFYNIATGIVFGIPLPVQPMKVGHFYPDPTPFT